MKTLRYAMTALAVTIATPASADIAGYMLSRVGAHRPAHCPPGLWCACGLSQKLKAKGYAPLPSYRARDAASYGIKGHGFKRDNIIVFNHHVGVSTGNHKACPAGKVQIVSDNHSNRTGIGCYSKKRVIAIRKAVR